MAAIDSINAGVVIILFSEIDVYGRDILLDKLVTIVARMEYIDVSPKLNSDNLMIIIFVGLYIMNSIIISFE